jgi:iron complex transport system permease protein
MKNTGPFFSWPALLAVLGGVFLFLVSLRIGTTEIPWGRMVRWVWQGATGNLDLAKDQQAAVFFYLRVPRVLMAGTIGALLASVGCGFQALFRNPLADPYLLGVSSGAALGAVVGLALGLSFPVPLACLGAVLTLGIVLSLARFDSLVSVTLLILAGAAVQSFSSSVLTLILSQMSGRYETSGIFFWLLGSLDTLPYKVLLPLMLCALAGLAFFFLWAPALNLLAQGEETALALGLDVERTKWILVLTCAVLTGFAVTFNGMLPFVGLIVPHAARLLFGTDHRRVLPLSAFLGATLLMGADAAGRSLMAPQEIPTGVITALIGAPFFLYILRRERKRLV